jgi:hypothetical protein
MMVLVVYSLAVYSLVCYLFRLLSAMQRQQDVLQY